MLRSFALASPTSFLTRRAVGALVLAATGTLAACGGGGGSDTRTPARIEAVGTAPAGTAGAALATLPSVRVVDASGQPVPGVSVTFTASAGTIAPATTTTGSEGTATLTSWTLGPSAGQQTLTATAAGVTAPATITVNVNAAAAAALVKTAGDNASGTVGTALATSPTVRVADQFGNSVAGVAVTFAVASGGGTLTGPTVTSGADGVARLGGWTLGTTSGTPQTVTATAPGLAAVTFTATGTPGTAAGLSKQSGDNQVAAANTAVAVAPTVKVVDSFGNGVAGVTVNFAAAGGGTVAPASVVSGADGIARPTSWTLGPANPTQTLTAIAGTLTTAFTATATGTTTPVGPPTQLTLQRSLWTSGGIGSRRIENVIALRDGNNNVVTGQALTVTATATQADGGAGTLQSGGTIVINAATGTGDVAVTVSVASASVNSGTYTLRFTVPARPEIPALVVSGIYIP